LVQFWGGSQTIGDLRQARLLDSSARIWKGAEDYLFFLGSIAFIHWDDRLQSLCKEDKRKLGGWCHVNLGLEGCLAQRWAALFADLLTWVKQKESKGDTISSKITATSDRWCLRDLHNDTSCSESVSKIILLNPGILSAMRSPAALRDKLQLLLPKLTRLTEKGPKIIWHPQDGELGN
jgi:hypothetical protein